MMRSVEDLFAQRNMSTDSANGNKRSKIEYFPSVGKIPYDPTGTNPLSFRHYNADEVVCGRPMKDWLRFSVCFWHTFRGTGMDPFGSKTLDRPWEEDVEDPMELAKRRIDVAFEFFTKLGVELYTFHDMDGKSFPADVNAVS
jgi:xylose isomerase